MASRQRQQQSPPAVTREEREAQMVLLAMDVAEQQMREGTASSQVISHFLKLGSTIEAVELQKKRKEVAMIEERTAQLKSTENVETLVNDAINAIKGYRSSS